MPHLTIADRAPVAAMRLAEADVAGGLPVHARVTQARLIAGSPTPNSWRTLIDLPLGVD